MMRLDLRFQDAAAEAAYRRHRLALVRPHGKAVEWMRLSLCLCFLARLALLHESAGSMAAALLSCGAVVTQLLMVGQEDLGLRYAVATVCEVLMSIGGTTFMPHLGLGGGGGAATPAQSLVALEVLTGPIWPLFSVARSPLPFSLLFPVLLAQSAIMVLQAHRTCAIPGVRHGYALLHQHLLRAAWRARPLPPPGPAALAAQSAAEGLCAAAYQPAFIILGNVLTGYLAFRAELAQRRAFVCRARSRALPVAPADYWLLFGLPAAAALAGLHMQVLGLRA